MIKKHFKKILLSILVLLIVAFGFTGNYFYNFALNPKVDKSAIVNQDSDGEKEDKTAVENWFESTKTEVTMESVTKNKLVGYKFVNPNAKKWIFVVHGYTSDAKKMAKYIKRFYDMGYSVFAETGSEGADAAKSGGGSKDALWKTITDLMKTWVTRLGGVVMFVGGIMFGLGWKSDDAEQKSRGVSTIIGGAIVIAIAQIAAKFFK